MSALPILVALFFGGLTMHFLPAMSRPDIYFAVTVPMDFRHSAQARSIRRHYRAIVWGLTLLGGAIALSGPQPASVPATLGTQIIGVWAAWAVAHRRVKPFALAAPASLPRVASLEPRTQGLPGGPIVAALPLLIIAGSALLIGMNWNHIPDRFPTRWSLDGTPIGWRTRTIWGVFGPLVMAAVVTTSMLWMARAIGSGTRQVAPTGMAALLERRFKRGNAVYLVLSAYFMAFLFSLMSVSPLFTQTTRLPTSIWIVFALIIVASFGITAWMYWIGQGGRRQVPVDEVVPPGDGSPDTGWKAGLIYYNPADPALLVEKRMGWGWTLNFGHKGAWLIVLVILAAISAPVVTSNEEKPVVALVPALFVLLGIPLIAGRVPRNWFYGYRSPRTMASDAAWYPANRVTGWALVTVGVAWGIARVIW